MKSKKNAYGSEPINHKQETLEETRKRINKVLDKLDNLKEDEGGEKKE